LLETWEQAMKIKQTHKGVKHPHDTNGIHYTIKSKPKFSETANSSGRKKASSELQPLKAAKTIEFHSRFVQKPSNEPIHDSLCNRKTYSFNPETLEHEHKILQKTSPYSTTTECNTRYVYNPIAQAIKQNYKFIATLSDMNSGKTYAELKLILKQAENMLSIIVIPLRDLCSSTTDRANIFFEINKTLDGRKKNAVNYDKLNDNNIHDADLVVSTYNSVPNVWETAKKSGKKINLVVFDESESGAQFMANGTITNKGEVAETIDELKLACNTMMLMDAHLGDRTASMINHFIDEKFHLINNRYSVWEGHTFSILKGEYKSGNAGGYEKVKELLRAGKRIVVTSTSAKYARKLHIMLEKEGLLKNLKVLRAYNIEGEAHTPELIEARSDNKKFLNYDLVIISPTNGTGISIEEDLQTITNNSEHFYCVVGFMTRDVNAPDIFSSLQLLFRARHTQKKHIILAFEDNKDITGSPKAHWEQIKHSKTRVDLYKRTVEDFEKEEKQQQYLKDAFTRQSDFELSQDILSADLFDKYFEKCVYTLLCKGMKRVEDNVQRELTKDDYKLYKALVSEANAEIAESDINAIVESKLPTDVEVAEIKSKERAGTPLTTKESKMIEKHRLLQSYHFSDAPPNEEEIKDYLKQKEKGVATARNNVVKASLKRADINKLTRAKIKGVGVEQDFKEDATSRAPLELINEWELDRILCDIADIEYSKDENKFIYNTSTVINDELLLSKDNGRKRPHLKRIEQIADRYNSTARTPISLAALSVSPTREVNRLIKNRLGIKTRKARNEEAYTLQKNQPVIENANKHLERGTFGILKQRDKISAIEAMDKDGNFKKSVRDKLGITPEYQQHIITCLGNIPVHKHSEVIAEYLRIASSERKKGDRFTPAANANGYILKQAGLKNSSTLEVKKPQFGGEKTQKSAPKIE